MIESACVLASWFGMKHDEARRDRDRPGRITRMAAAANAAFAAANSSTCSRIETSPIVKKIGLEAGDDTGERAEEAVAGHSLPRHPARAEGEAFTGRSRDPRYMP